jgi:L-2-hydroxyglutarate oxidase
VVIGAGAVGLSVAYKLVCAFPGIRVLVLEKENQVAGHQTGHNSGVIHSGIYYKPGSYKAKNCIAGREQLVAFCKQHQIAHEVCGKIILAVDASELEGLEGIYKRGLENGLTACKKIGIEEIKEIEPFAKGIAAVFVPYTGIVDFVGVCQKLRVLIEAANGSAVRCNQPVIQFRRHSGGYTVQTKTDRFETRFLISCAGLFSDRLAKMDGLTLPARIVGFRGDYYDLTPAASHKVKNLIYPVPNPAFPFLGVHFTRMVLGGVECGPNAVFTFKREGYGKTDFSWQDTIEALGYSGTWKLFWKHWRFGLAEYRRAFSKSLFLNQIQRMVPGITASDLVTGRSGVRAMALAPDGTMIDDFLFAKEERSIHVLNAPSPAATACLAIGDEIVSLAQAHFNLA